VPLNDLWGNRLDLLNRHRKLLLAGVLMFDAYLGLNKSAGAIVWSGLLNGDLTWMFQSAEMMAGGLLIIHIVFSSTKEKWGLFAAFPALILLVVLVLGTLELLLSGLGRSATVNFNLSAIGMSGLYWTAAYLSVAAGLALTYKVQRFGNFAQAEMMILGSYVAITLMWSDRFFPVSDAPRDDILNWNLLIWAGITAFFVTGLTGLVIDRVVHKRFRKKAASPQVMMIASLGIAMVLRALLYMRFSAATFRFVPDRDWRLAASSFSISTERLQLSLGERGDLRLTEWATNVNPYAFTYMKTILIAGVFGSVLLLLVVLHRTRLGRRMRAVSDNPDLAASTGINVERVHSTSAFLSAGISGLGGALLAGVLPINPELGLSLLLPAFAVIVFGTIGSLPGVIIGALFIGLVRAGSEPLLIAVGSALDRPTMTGFAEVMPFIFLVGVLLIMPRGIGEAMTQWRIERMRRRTKVEGVGIRDRLPPVRVLIGRYLAKSRFTGIRLNHLRDIKNRSLTLMETAGSNALTGMKAVRGRLLVLMGVLITMPFARLWNRRPHGLLILDRETERGSWIVFLILFVVLTIVALMLPSASVLTKVMQIARIVTLLGIFSLMAFSLNLHTGITGMTNFGVIFFVGIGAITVGLLCAPVETNGYGWMPWQATILAVLISALAGWLLAYPTARLRMDYLAIVTISLGEILRILLMSEPLLRAGTVTTAIGISQYVRPLEEWWDSGPSEAVGNLIGINVAAPYVVVLAIMCLVSVVTVWWFLGTILASPWGRILRSIREDEEVSQHHGHNIFTHKAASLALGAAVAGLAGALWAWLNTGVFPEFMNPVRSTFLVWAAFIVGGRGNNRGMIIGAFLIIIVEFVFNVMVVARGSASLPLHGLVAYIDGAFKWLVADLGGLFWSNLSITEVFLRGNVIVNLAYLKLALIGIVIIVVLQVAAKGLIPEVPVRPIPSKDLRKHVEEVTQ
jgi:branched-chain amino acid transport system permease protein